MSLDTEARRSPGRHAEVRSQRSLRQYLRMLASPILGLLSNRPTEEATVAAEPADPRPRHRMVGEDTTGIMPRDILAAKKFDELLAAPELFDGLPPLEGQQRIRRGTFPRWNPQYNDYDIVTISVGDEGPEQMPIIGRGNHNASVRGVVVRTATPTTIGANTPALRKTEYYINPVDGRAYSTTLDVAQADQGGFWPVLPPHGHQEATVVGLEHVVQDLAPMLAVPTADTDMSTWRGTHWQPVVYV